MDAGNVLEAMKAELEGMRREKICMEARLIAAESALEENKRVVSEYIAIEKLADDLLLDIAIEAGPDNVHENNGQNLDEETMKVLIEEAMRDFTEALNEAQSRGSRPADGGNGGGYDGRSRDQNLDGTNINIAKEARGDGGGNKGGNGGAHA